MIIFRTIAAAFSMFSAVPMPQITWNKKNMRFFLCAFPLIGLLIGALCWLWVIICEFLHLPNLLQGAILCLLPVMVTGGIHLDGYCDTCDALASHSSLARRREILKDSHMGAFGCIHLCGYLLISFALWTTLPEYAPLAILLSFCLSRSLSGLAVATFPLTTDTGLVHTFATVADKTRVKWILGIMSLLLCAGLCALGWTGVFMVLVALLTFAYFRWITVQRFGGLSGDLSGWFLQMAELWMLIALCAVKYIEVLL